MHSFLEHDASLPEIVGVHSVIFNNNQLNLICDVPNIALVTNLEADIRMFIKRHHISLTDLIQYADQVRFKDLDTNNIVTNDRAGIGIKRRRILEGGSPRTPNGDADINNDSSSSNHVNSGDALEMLSNISDILDTQKTSRCRTDTADTDINSPILSMILDENDIGINSPLILTNTFQDSLTDLDESHLKPIPENTTVTTITNNTNTGSIPTKKSSSREIHNYLSSSLSSTDVNQFTYELFDESYFIPKDCDETMSSYVPVSPVSNQPIAPFDLSATTSQTSSIIDETSDAVKTLAHCKYGDIDSINITMECVPALVEGKRLGKGGEKSVHAATFKNAVKTIIRHNDIIVDVNFTETDRVAYFNYNGEKFRNVKKCSEIKFLTQWWGYEVLKYPDPRSQYIVKYLGISNPFLCSSDEVPFVEVGIDAGTYFLNTNRFASGTNFIPPKLILSFLNNILQGYSLLHERQWIHGDSKLDNVIVQVDSDGKFKTCKIVDFGGTVKQGENYDYKTVDSPERVRGNTEASNKEDVFGIGSMLLLLLNFNGDESVNPRECLDKMQSCLKEEKTGVEQFSSYWGTLKRWLIDVEDREKKTFFHNTNIFASLTSQWDNINHNAMDYDTLMCYKLLLLLMLFMLNPDQGERVDTKWCISEIKKSGILETKSDVLNLDQIF